MPEYDKILQWSLVIMRSDVQNYCFNDIGFGVPVSNNMKFCTGYIDTSLSQQHRNNKVISNIPKHYPTIKFCTGYNDTIFLSHQHRNNESRLYPKKLTMEETKHTSMHSHFQDV